MDAITPEAGGFISLIDVFRENFVHENWHRCFSAGQRKSLSRILTRTICHQISESRIPIHRRTGEILAWPTYIL